MGGNISPAHDRKIRLPADGGEVFLDVCCIWERLSKPREKTHQKKKKKIQV